MKQSSRRSAGSLIDRGLALIERTPLSDRILLRFAFFAVLLTGIWLVLAFNNQYTETTPTRGGEITEGIIGTPRFINPALAFTRTDQDVTSLVYSGLLRIDENGQLVNDLAESVEVSEDGTTYTIRVRNDVSFHDGTPLTARDVAFTIQLIQNPDLKSPLRGNWSDVTIGEVDEYTLTLTLDEPYAPFIENLTLGIMPAHAWSNLPVEQLPFSQLNTEPIGSGPYAVADAGRDTSGLITNYTLEANRVSNNPPNIDQINLRFFQNEAALEDALESDDIDATAYLSDSAVASFEGEYQILSEPLPRIFGLFFNQNRSPALRDNAARAALAAAIDRETLITDVVNGYGVPTKLPTPQSMNAVESEVPTSTSTSTGPAAARAILEAGGWNQNDLGLWEKTIDGDVVPLEVVVRTSNAAVFAATVDNIAAAWEAADIAVVTEQFEQTGLVQSVIRPRDFQALLFGLDMSRSYDLYPFWHSSQQDDPGLNVAQYANVTVDDLLEEARDTQDPAAREALLVEASTIIAEESPAVFLFQPTMTYVVDEKVTVTPFTMIARPSDRFSTVADWHTEEESLWSWFQNTI